MLIVNHRIQARPKIRYRIARLWDNTFPYFMAGLAALYTAFWSFGWLFR